MKKKLISLLLALVMIVALAVPAFAEDVLLIAPAPTSNLPEVGEGSIVILHTNDIHTYIDNDGLRYSDVAALKAHYESLGAIVILVDAGDHIQGTAYGSMDKGKTIIDLMNAVGYDVATLGNHEFDYGMEGAMNAIDWAEYPYTSCNFYHEDKGVAGGTVLKPYELVDLGFLKIAFVGITTPESFTKSTPAYFQDGNGNYIYGIAGGEDGSALYASVQKALDAAVAEADIVVGLGHLGDDPASMPWTSEEVIANTTGFDFFIDGHSHSTVVGKEVTDKDGNTVYLSQTGEYLGGIGVMIPNEDHTTDAYLLDAEDVASYGLTRDANVEAIENAWIEEINTQLGKIIGSTEDKLANYDENGNRLVRSQETNVGDLCADALYYLFDNMGLDVDVAIMNGGGIRNKTTITGELSYLTMKEIHTFGNVACLQTITGQQLLDALEWGAKNVGSGENGGFLHVSGIKYTINTAIPSTVQADEKGVWTGAPTGAYRVMDVQILQDGVYVPLDLTAKYNLAGYNYTLRDLGDGFAMFGGAVNVLDYVMEDYMVLANYVQSFEGGKLTGYAEPQGRISIIDEPVTELTAGANTVYVYAPKSELTVSSTCTAPAFIVFGDKPYTAASAQAEAEASGLAALAAARGATIVFVNPQGETWTEADIPVYTILVSALYSNASDSVYVNGIAQALDWLTGATSLKVLGDTGHAYVYGVGSGADFVGTNLLMSMAGSQTFPDGNTITFDRTPAGVVLVNPTVAPAPVGTKDMTVSVVNGPTNTAEVLASFTDLVSISTSEVTDGFDSKWVTEDFNTFTGTYRRQAGVLLPIHDWAAEGITETVITYAASVTDFFTGETTELPYHSVVYYANDLNVNDPANPVPLVLTFHGGGNTALYQAQASEWPLIGKANGFITVAVDNHTALTGAHIAELVEHLKTLYAIDASRIYASGFSMGSVKSWELFDNPMFAGVAPMSGSFAAPVGEPAGHIMPTFYVGGEASPLPELCHQGPDIINRVTYLMKANKINDSYTYNPDVNLFWGVNGDLTYQVTDKVAFKDSVLTVNLFASENGRYYTALASSGNMSHEVYARNSWAAWDFLKQFSRAADGSVVIEDATYTLASDDGKVVDNTYNTVELPEPEVTTYTVVKGDTLWGIAAKYLGSGYKWKAIFDANTDVIANPNLIYVGQTLIMP